MKKEDDEQIDTILKRVFFDYEGGDDNDIYFDEFISIAQNICSELYVAVIDCIYKCVPCVKNFFLMRANFINLLEK